MCAMTNLFFQTVTEETLLRVNVMSAESGETTEVQQGYFQGPPTPTPPTPRVQHAQEPNDTPSAQSRR